MILLEETRKKNKNTSEKKIRDLLFFMNLYGIKTIKQVILALKYHPDFMRIDSHYEDDVII